MGNELVRQDQEHQDLLKELIMKRLSGSTVLPIEEIQNIQMSLNFVLSKGELSNSLKQQFESGKNELQRKIADTEKLYKHIMENLEDYGVLAIRESLMSFADFFKQYQLDFTAHQVNGLSLDYLLAQPVDDQTYQGIDFVENYLTRFNIEADFLNKFPKEQLLLLFQRASHQLDYDYQIDVNNLFELVFFQSLAKKFVGNQSSFLLSSFEIAYLWGNKSSFLLNSRLFLEEINNEYYFFVFEKLVAFITGLQNETALGNLFITLPTETNTLSVNPPMSAVKYNQLQEKIRKGIATKEIANFLESPYDLLELVEDETISPKNIITLINEIAFPLFAAFVLLIRKKERQDWHTIVDLRKLLDIDTITLGIKSRAEKLELEEVEGLTIILQKFELDMTDFN
ncbi:DUF6179 domain-containing protein [Enterococcus sp. AZ103]|uniref:DUF6179 domain-containing protein n=1 Tax=Enterococcus sp. AZ103 TaxID=2774628 RepID=UPI003F1EC4A8